MLISHCGIEVEPQLDMDAELWDLRECTSVKMADLPLDILSKCIVCLAHLGGVHHVRDSVEPIIKGDLEVRTSYEKSPADLQWESTYSQEHGQII